MPTNKPFMDINDQIIQLKGRNLNLRNNHATYKTILYNNYFNLINGHETLLLNNKSPKRFRKVSFSTFIRLHRIDRSISSYVYKCLSIFETKLQSIIAYRWSEYLSSTPPQIYDNLKYLEISNYMLPSPSSGPSQYTSYFYDSTNNKKRHCFFKTYNFNNCSFDGSFNGTISIGTDAKYILDGVFTGIINGRSRNIFKAKLYTSNCYPVSSTPVFLNSICAQGNLSELNYSDYQKTQKDYVNEYTMPPLWVIIKTLTLNDLILLLYGLPTVVLNKVLIDFNLTINDRQKFLNSLDIIKGLRNNCAHHELVTRYRTPQTLSIDPNLIRDLNLHPKRSTYILKMKDVIRVLNMYVSTKIINIIITRFYFVNFITGKNWLSKKYIKRIGI